MQLALSKARLSPPKPTNFCVGACLVHTTSNDSTLLETGYTLECEGNTHAEQSCFIKLSQKYECDDERLGEHLPADGTIDLYTTMEPCNQRSVGNLPCVERILRSKRADGRQAIGKVYVGVQEPEKFVGVNEGKRKLEEAGIQVVHVPGFEDEILKVATAGHVDDDKKS